MGVYAITGATSGIGASCAKMLKEQGHKVISISRGEGADIRADLSIKAERDRAIKELQAIAADGLDGFIANSGVGPSQPGERIVSLNYFAAKEMTEAAFPLVQKKDGVILVVSSNSANLPALNTELVDIMCNANDEEAARAYAGKLVDGDKQQAYQGSKFAIGRWVRRNSSYYITHGVRMNAIAPGATWTKLMEEGLADPVFSDSMKTYPVPALYGKPGLNGMQDPDDIAKVMLFLLSPESKAICGAFIYADGGTDGFMRTERC